MPNGQLKKAIKKIKEEKKKDLNDLEAKVLATYKPSAIDPVGAFRTALTSLAQAFSSDSPAEVLGPAWGQLKEIEDTVKKFAEPARKRVMAFVLQNGRRVTDAGTLEARIGDFAIRIVPNKTGYDPAKVEAALLAKKADLSRYMQQVISYKLDTGKLIDAINNKVLTQAEVEACRYDDPGYAVHKPKLVGEE